MHLSDYYLELRRRYEQVGEAEPAAVTLEELSGLLNCTPRNVKLLLKRMKESGWISWLPGRGRGNTSKIIFHVPLDQLLLDQAKQLVEKGDLTRGLELIGGLEDAQARVVFFDWLGERFGYREERKAERLCETLRIPFYKKVMTLDPAYTVYGLDSHFSRHIFDTLVKYIPETGQFVPHLAYAWETDEERLEWTFHLRKQVLFHHGRELKASDVVYTVERMRSPSWNSPFSWMVEEIEGVRAVREHTVVFRLHRPNRMFLNYISSDRMSIVPEEVCSREREAFASAPVGTGPFRVVQNDDSKLVMDAFPLYFKERALLDRIELWVIPDFNQTEGWTSGVDEAMTYLPFIDRDDEMPSGWGQVYDAGVHTKYVVFNLRKDGPHKDERFRQSVLSFIRETGFWRGEGASRLTQAESFYYTEGEASGSVMRTGVSESKGAVGDTSAALPRPGSFGIPSLKLGYTSIRPEEEARLREAFASEGIELSMERMPRSRVEIGDEFGDTKEGLQFDAVISGVIIDGDDPQLSLIETYETRASCLAGYMDDAAYQEIKMKLHAIRAESDSRKRGELFAKLDRWMEKSGYLTFLYHKHMKTTHHPSMKGVHVNGLGWADFRNIWFEKSV
ncbi:ABC transporter substrate-binding protein [Paenibacillus turpanensis]|uniref:ABC transporter substrate-binding protein n=1 Tax=Paenibacillus turpanensis TaxID=2689078 RepID=UPI00140C0D4D|nr:ABC transporter substrate-binding protein [Paenibacillus turpanensis]